MEEWNFQKHIDELENKLQSHTLWKDCHPIALGSWARGELCPGSDLDLIFLGPEDTVFKLISDLQEMGLKIRYRIPQDMNDWTVAVKIFDIFSLLTAKPFTELGEKSWLVQIEKIKKNKVLTKNIFKELLSERKHRTLRFDSMTNFLEPNIKQGPGGLRDIEQSLQILKLYESFSDSHAVKILKEVKMFLLPIRAELHLLGFHDQLIASEQMELAKKLGISSVRDFMRQVNRGLARANFYSEWLFENIKATKKQRAQIQSTQFSHGPGALMLLTRDSGPLMQKKIRQEMDQIIGEKVRPDKIRGKLLKQTILMSTSDAVTVAVFRSRFIDKICPRIKRLIGYVQHDQYHRFTAEAHLLQAVRETKRVWKNPKTIGKLGGYVKKLTTQDWEILSWVALYHDLAKGLETDHSLQGERWVNEDLKKFKVPVKIKTEVAFLVRYHLELSLSAFHKNPQDPKTWTELFDLGFDSQRLLRLLVFTVIDIKATNPEAWNSWKENLLFDCMKSLLAPEKKLFYLLKKTLGQTLGQRVESLDLQLFSIFSKAAIGKDLALVNLQDQPSVVIIKDKNKKVWLRFHQNEDKLGLFAKYVRALFEAGVSIQQAIVQTLPQIGVYDLFQISNQKNPLQILKRVEQSLLSSQVPAAPQVKLNRLEVVSQNDLEVVLSFKGIDQRGLLWAIAEKLQKENVSVLSARVHTWGRQVDDLIHISPPQDLEVLMRNLKNEFMDLTEALS